MSDKPKNFTIKKRLSSFKYAFAGLRSLLVLEHNARIHLVAAIIAVSLSIILKLSTLEWLIILFVIGLVFVTELLNSAIENLANKVSSDYSKRIKRSKDYGAAAVLIASVIALLAGALIFIPKILFLLK